MDRDALIANLEWMLACAPVPEKEVDALGPAMLPKEAIVELIASGQALAISRRSMREIIRHLKD